MIRRTLALTVICSATAALAASSASAQTSCGPREDLVKVLSEQYKENPVGIGLAQPGLVEVFASSSGSWTMVMTLPNGKACLIAAGENWEMVTKVKGNPV